MVAVRRGGIEIVRMVSMSTRLEDRMTRTAKLVISVLLFYQSLLSAAQAESNVQLIEAAKSEGVLSYYTTMTLSQSKKVVDKFQQKYPFIKDDVFRGGGDGGLNRIQTEARAGRS